MLQLPITYYFNISSFSANITTFLTRITFKQWWLFI